MDIGHTVGFCGDGQRVDVSHISPDSNGLIPFDRLVLTRHNYSTSWGCLCSALSTAVGDRTLCPPVLYLTGQVKRQMPSMGELLRRITGRFR